MYTLYDFLPFRNDFKARLLLSQLGLKYTLIEKDIIKDETHTPDFLALKIILICLLTPQWLLRVQSRPKHWLITDLK